MTPSTIITDRLVLRPLMLSDADALVDGLNDLKVSAWLTVVPFPYTQADAIWFINECLAGREISWAITQNDRVIGMIGLGNSLGYWLRQDAWGQGVVTEAARAILDAHFADSDVQMLVSEYFVGNARSANTLRKLGFRPTGTHETFSKAQNKSVTSQKMRLHRADWLALSVVPQ